MSLSSVIVLGNSRLATVCHFKASQTADGQRETKCGEKLTDRQTSREQAKDFVIAMNKTLRQKEKKRGSTHKHVNGKRAITYQSKSTQHR